MEARLRNSIDDYNEDDQEDDDEEEEEEGEHDNDYDHGNLANSVNRPAMSGQDHVSSMHRQKCEAGAGRGRCDTSLTSRELRNRN